MKISWKLNLLIRIPKTKNQKLNGDKYLSVLYFIPYHLYGVLLCPTYNAQASKCKGGISVHTYGYDYEYAAWI